MPSPFVRRGGGGFLGSLLRALGEGAHGFQMYQRFGPTWRDEERKIADDQQARELLMQDRRSGMQDAEVNRQRIRLENAQRLAQLVADSQEGAWIDTAEAAPSGTMNLPSEEGGLGYEVNLPPAAKPAADPRVSPDLMKQFGVEPSMGEIIEKAARGRALSSKRALEGLKSSNRVSDREDRQAHQREGWDRLDSRQRRTIEAAETRTKYIVGHQDLRTFFTQGRIDARLLRNLAQRKDGEKVRADLASLQAHYRGQINAEQLADELSRNARQFGYDPFSDNTDPAQDTFVEDGPRGASSLPEPAGQEPQIPAWVQAIISKGSQATPEERAQVQRWRASIR